MIDEQKLRELAEAAKLSIQQLSDMSALEFEAAEAKRFEFRESAPSAILALLDELAILRQERTAWRVTAENAEAAVKQARVDALEKARKYCDELATFLACHQDIEGEKLIDSVRDSIDAMKEIP